MKKGIIVDLETTGIDSEVDKIIELGWVEFSYSQNDDLKILNMQSALEDPGVPLTPEIQKITGINDQMLAGQKIDWSLFATALESADIVIAHNAEFDKKFLEKVEELDFSSVQWGCSMKHIDWAAHGFKTRALNYLAADHGFVNSFAHRALFDCATTLRLIGPYLQELEARSRMKQYCIYATSAPFAVKDKLKENQYRWNPEKRVWYKEVMEDGIDKERVFLAEHIYQGPDLHEECLISI